jgi:hypothetical protein
MAAERGDARMGESHLRGWAPPLYFRESDLKLDFGF